ncbi:MAG: aminodeoxychorismate synthase, component I [Nitrospirales bacterium]|nr:MAG: aminodeoxychorismate synthase, component I [Nitrospirales bacterium]
MPVADESPFELYVRLTGCSRSSFLLESGGANSKLAQYSYIGCEPYQTFSAKGRRYEMRNRDGCVGGEGNTFAKLAESFGPISYERLPHFPPFLGGAVGFFSYDMARQFERIPELAVDDLQLPDMVFLFVEVFAAIDHVSNVVHVVFAPEPKRWSRESRDQLLREGQERLREWHAHLVQADRHVNMIRDWPHVVPASIEGQQSRAQYIDRVRHCQELIAAGDIYQANLSHRFTMDLPQAFSEDHHEHGGCWYQRIRHVNPSPFSALLIVDDYTIVSNSPERLVRVEGQRVDMRPIAGTRPRGATVHEDRRLIEELLSSPKERAEHIMLVDLVRNDLGRVCQSGTIVADQLMTVERYSHVSHLVSNISGRIRQDVSAFDVLRAAFPGGTITGVPKVHCMEIIEQLEPVRRGVYTGSLGYISWTGAMDMNILIRTVLLTSKQGYLQVGAGIVADSIPCQEYDETVHKAEAFFQALSTRKE